MHTYGRAVWQQRAKLCQQPTRVTHSTRTVRPVCVNVDSVLTDACMWETCSETQHLGGARTQSLCCMHAELGSHLSGTHSERAQAHDTHTMSSIGHPTPPSSTTQSSPPPSPHFQSPHTPHTNHTCCGTSVATCPALIWGSSCTACTPPGCAQTPQHSQQLSAPSLTSQVHHCQYYCHQQQHRQWLVVPAAAAAPAGVWLLLLSLPLLLSLG